METLIKELKELWFIPTLILLCLLALKLMPKDDSFPTPDSGYSEHIAVMCNDIVTGAITIETAIESINETDTVSYYLGRDIITVIPLKNNEYILYSEISRFPIAVLNKYDTQSLIGWIIQYPINNEDDARWSNIYYQDIIEEKIWE